MSHTFDPHARPIIFGELLFDHYPNGKKVLGGAPLNVAWHLKGFGLRPLLVTRIGQDLEGELALTDLIRWGLDTRSVQIDAQHKTGNVIVSELNGNNQFEINSDQAWDYISNTLVMDWISSLPCSMIYSGSLAQRHSVSRKTIQRIILDTQLPVLVDINLRAPWHEYEIIDQCLEDAHWLKISDEELKLLTEKKTDTTESLQRAALELKTKHDISELYVTCGEKGAMLIHENGFKKVAARPIKAVDTVGAGDAFSAIIILGLHLGWDENKKINNANQFASRICQAQGGTPLKQHDYDQLLEQWQIS